MLQRKIEDFLPAHPVYYFRDCTSTGLRQPSGKASSSGGAEQQWCIYVCMREDHLYIELIEQEKNIKHTHTHKKENYTDAVVFAKLNCKETK